MRRLLTIIQSQLSYKIILPYLALTLLVMMAGAAIAVGLVAASLEERIQNQLAQVARNTTDALVRRERNQLDFLQLIASAPRNQDVPAVAEAFASGDAQDVIRALTPYYGFAVSNLNLDIDRMIAFDREGKTFVDWQRVAEDPNTPPAALEGTDISQVDVVRNIVTGTLVNGNDKFANLIYFLPDNQPYFYTIAPVKQNTTIVGGVLIGIKVDRLLKSLEKSSQSVVTTFYDLNGTAIGTTLISRPELESLRMAPEVLRALQSGEAQSIMTVDIRQRDYRLAYSPLVIADEQVGYFSVGLSNDFQVQSLSLNRNIIILIAVALALGTVLLGYFIARSITRPLTALVTTAEAVTAGDLERRTTITSIDEFGQLAQAFNQMTEHLLRLYRASRDLSTSIEVEPVLDVTARTVQSFAPGSAVLALLADGAGLRYRVAPGAPPEAAGLENVRVAIDDPLLRDLAEHRTTVLLDPQQEPRLEPTGLGDVAGFRSVLLAPLVVQDQLAGVLILGHAEPGAFGGAVEPTLTAVANMAASVLYNAVLFDRVQDEASQRKAILQSIADGVVVCDRQQNIMLVNQAAEQMLGLHDWQIVRHSLRDIPLKRVETSEETLDLFGERQTIEHYELNERVVSLSRAPVIGEGGVNLGEVIVLHDISAEAAVDEAKTNFIATISHELRSPLTVMYGYIDLMLRGLVGELGSEQRELLEAVRNRVDLIHNIVKNGILVASIESNTLEIELEPQELWVAVDQAIASVRAAFTKKGLEIRDEVPKDIPQVLADREQLQVILGQLLDNARRYTKSGGVTIRAERQDGFVHVSVSDTGPGIPFEQQGRLFTRFHRVEGNSSPERGSGLGLVITRQLVERQGGRVWATSEVGSGSTFSFSLPIAHDDTRLHADRNKADATA